MSNALTPQEEQTLIKSLARAHEQGWGTAFGLVCGLGLFVVTVVLVIRGGPDVGAHLNLHAVYFPGYRVSWLGSLIGFVYAFVVGYGLGRSVATIYNRFCPD